MCFCCRQHEQIDLVESIHHRLLINDINHIDWLTYDGDGGGGGDDDDDGLHVMFDD